MRRAIISLGHAAEHSIKSAAPNVPIDKIARHRPVMSINGNRALVPAGTYVAQNANILGNVILYNDVTVWPGATIRGDKNTIYIANNTTIQDRAVISTVSELETGFPSVVDIGAHCVIGHGSVVVSSDIGNKTHIGAGAIIGAGSIIGNGAVIAPGSVVEPGTFIKDGEFWAGNPAKFIREVADEELDLIAKICNTDYELAREHDEEFLPVGTLYQEVEKY